MSFRMKTVDDLACLLCSHLVLWHAINGPSFRESLVVSLASSCDCCQNLAHVPVHLPTEDQMWTFDATSLRTPLTIRVPKRFFPPAQREAIQRLCNEDYPHQKIRPADRR